MFAIVIGFVKKVVELVKLGLGCTWASRDNCLHPTLRTLPMTPINARVPTIGLSFVVRPFYTRESKITATVAY